jgi:oxygen-independent coproporphyrinogen III oxidase
MQPISTTVNHLYVHVPFCAEKCQYCAFYSKPDSAQKMSAYVDVVISELGQAKVVLAPATIFFGGGTPSLLPVASMRRLLEAVSNTGKPREWTIECNPATVTAEKAALYREFGVNRISLGVQSFDDVMLKSLGRIHTGDQARKVYDILRAAGFDNINLDFIFGLPGQTLEHWQDTLRQAIALQPEHIATYCLILEEDTPFWSLARQGRIETDEELERAIYESTIDTLGTAGYRQYEVSNFSKPGKECAHNIAYWEGKDYLGLGPSACSTIRNHRWQNIPDTDRYVEAISHRLSAVSFEEELTEKTKVGERAAFGMRMNAGIPADLVRGRWDKEVSELLRDGLVELTGDRLRPTRRGILFADEVAAEFV